MRESAVRIVAWIYEIRTITGPNFGTYFAPKNDFILEALPRICSGLPHGLLLGARVFAATRGGLPHGLLLGSCVFSNYSWWAPAWAPFGLLYFCRYLRWAPAWAPSGLLCFAGHGVLAAKNTIVGFEIRKFPVFLQLWS